MKIHQITSKLDRMKLADGNRLLEKIIATEKPHSVRRNELEDLLKARKTRELRRENRAA